MSYTQNTFGDAWLHLKKPYYCISNTQVTHLFASNQISQESKFISTIYLLYPTLRTRVEKYYELKDINEVPKEEIHGISESEQFTIATTIAVFSQISCNCNFLHRCASNARTHKIIRKVDYPLPLKETFMKFLVDVNWFESTRHFSFIEQMGWVIGVNRSGCIDINTHVDNLMPLDHYAKVHLEVSQWAIALLGQARYMYRNYNLSSIRAGINVIPVIRSFFRTDIFGMSRDLQELESLARVMAGRPYMGITNYLPLYMRIHNHPRIVYIGILFHNRSARSRYDIIDTSLITKYVSLAGDGLFFKKQCEAIANGLFLIDGH